MPIYLAGRRNSVDPNEVEVYGNVEAADVVEAADKAGARWPGADLGVMPPKAVRIWMGRGGALQAGLRAPE